MLASANMPEFGITISIGQTGRIPFYAKSILFWGDIGGMQITFNDHPLAFTAQSSTVNYTIYGADVSAYAGQTGQLLFTLPPFVGTANLDNIQFSISPVPEPGKIALASIGILFFGFRRWQRTSPN